jgi:hypothetical protein
MTGTVRPAVLRRPRTTALVVLASGLCALLAACAPPPSGSLETLERLARRGAEHRARSLAALEATLVLRVDGRATGRLPAVSVQARLASPDRVRLQVRWLLGLLLDLNASGDTLTAWIPSERLGLRVPALTDSLGLRDPARFLGTALAATWQAPHTAWREAVADSAGVGLEWSELSEHWHMRVDREGRPREVGVESGGHEVNVRYSTWRGAGTAAWPQRLEVGDDAGWVQLRLDIEDVRAARRARPSWFTLVLPEDARRLELDDLKRVLSSRGAAR